MSTQCLSFYDFVVVAVVKNVLRHELVNFLGVLHYIITGQFCILSLSLLKHQAKQMFLSTMK